MSQTNWSLLQAIGDNPEVLRPLGNYIVVELFKAEKESQGGIALPDQVLSQRRPALARIIKAGPGQRALMDAQPVGMWVKDGDLVVVLKHTAIEILLGNRTHHVIAEGDIVARVDEEQLQPYLDALEAAADEQTPPEPDAEPEPVDPVVQTDSGLWVPREAV